MFKKKSKHKKIGLALGSGGTRGLALIGVLKVLERHGIKVDYIAGSSVGAIVGGVYAINGDLDNVEKIATSIGYGDIIGSLVDIGRTGGLIQGNTFLKKIKTFVGEQKIEETKIPFTAVTTDMQSGESIILDKGDLAKAMRASASMPIVFDPVPDSEHRLIDGGISQNVPVEAVRQMGADIVIAVNLSQNALTYESKSPVSTIQHYIILMLKNLADKDCQNADIVISPQFEQVDWLRDINNRALLITSGERAAEEKIEEILEAVR
jgi:NTE family protein